MLFDFFIKTLQNRNAIRLEESIFPFLEPVPGPLHFTGIYADPHIIFTEVQIILFLLQQVLQGEAGICKVLTGNIGIGQTMIDIRIFRGMFKQAF